MPALARFLLICGVALLAACSSQPSAPPPQPRVVGPVGEFSPSSNDVLFRAIGLVGTPYRYGGNTPDSGFDCSGLIGFVYRDAAGIGLPRTTRDLAGMKLPKVERGSLQPGDLVFFATAGGRSVSHAGIYVGEGRFVHAPSSGGTVRLDRLADRYWQNAWLSGMRVIANNQIASHP